MVSLSSAQGTIPPYSVYSLWPAPNSVNPASRAGLVIGVEVPLTLITVLVVSLRVYTRGVITKSIGLDDWLMAASACFCVVLMAVNLASLSYGWGRHIWDFDYTWFVPARKLEYATEIFFGPSAALTKLSILIFYLRIFPDKKLRIFAYGGIVFVSLWFIFTVFGAIFQCRPINSIWNIQVTGTCGNNYIGFIWSSVTNSASDLFVFFLPIPLVWKIRLPRRQRIGLVCIFALGAIVCLAGVVRIYYIVTLFRVETYDFTWAGVPLFVIGEVEILLGVLGPSLPALKPLVVKYFPNFLGTNSADWGSEVKFSGQRLEISSSGDDITAPPPVHLENFRVEQIPLGKPNEHVQLWNVESNV